MIKRLVVKNTKKLFTDKNGKEHQGTMFYLELENGNFVAVKPVFTEDYKYFNLLAEKVQ